MADLSFYVGIIGNIISILMFLSPVSTFIRIWRNRSTEGFESLPYVCTLLNSSLWFYYGIINDEYLVSTVNGFGIVVEIVYVALFLAFVPPQLKVKTWILVGSVDIGFLGTAILVTKMALPDNVQIGALGLFCAALNIIMYASPLVAMKKVVVTKSVEYMPFWLSFSLFLNGGVWALYAVLHRDIYLLVPNGSGCALGGVQLLLYAAYMNTKSSKGEVTERLIEEGSQTPSKKHSSSTAPDTYISIVN